MTSATRLFVALLGLSAALVWPMGAGAQVVECCDTVVAVPTSYVATSYVATSFAVPTVRSTVLRPVIAAEAPVVYESTSYVVERPRRGLLSGLFGPRYRETAYYTQAAYVPTAYVPTTYVPTTYEVVAPTTYTTSYVPTSLTTYWPTTVTLDAPVVPTVYVDPCLGSTVAASAIPTRQVTGSPQGSAVSPPKNVQSRPSGSGTDSSRGVGGSLNEPPYEFPSNATPEKTESGVLAPIDDGTGRTSFRPRATDLTRQTSGTALGALRGEVVSATDGKPQPNVRVVFSDLRNTFKDRERQTDATGRFDLMLPNGDWAVSVAELDGKMTPYGSITATSGRFFDERDRLVSSLRINH
jgi:hypothetical protein